MTDPREQIRTAIDRVLKDFVQRPFFNLREADPQAVLLAELRSCVEPDSVAVNLVPRNKPRHSHPETIETSRVHREMKLDGQQLDLIVFQHGTEVELTVHDHGPLDITATVRGQDLCAVVEIKAAPSKNMWPDFEADLLKLSRITHAYPTCLGFFVLFDKSLALGATKSNVRANELWLSNLAPDPDSRMEAHWLNVNHLPTYRQFRAAVTP